MCFYDVGSLLSLYCCVCYAVLQGKCLKWIWRLQNRSVCHKRSVCEWTLKDRRPFPLTWSVRWHK